MSSNRAGFDGTLAIWWAAAVLGVVTTTLLVAWAAGRAALAHSGRCLAHVMPPARAVLKRFAHVPELGAGEHVGTFGNTGDAGFVDIGRGRLDSPQRLKRVGSFVERALLERITVQSRAPETGPKPPSRAFGAKEGLSAGWCKGIIRLK